MDKVEDVVGAATCLLRERGAPLLAGEAAVAHLLHLFELGQVVHHLLLRQSPEGAEADVPVPGVPAPGRLFAPRRQAHGATNVLLQDVEASRRSPDLDQQLLPLIEDPKKAGVDVHPAAGLIHLAEAEDVRRKTGNVVHPRQHAVFTTLAREEDGVVPFNLDDGAITEADRAADVRVELGQCSSGVSHVICVPGVEHPPHLLTILPWAELGEDPLLLDLEDALRRRSWGRIHRDMRGWRRVEDDAMGHQQGLIMVIGLLGQMGLALFVPLLGPAHFLKMTFFPQ
jgi:hypothetical protein